VLIDAFVDIKPDNVLVSIPNLDAIIEQTLIDDPSATYPPLIEPSISPEPILTVESQPLAFTEDVTNHQNFEIRLADFVEGDQIDFNTSLFVADYQNRDTWCAIAQEVGKRAMDKIQSFQLRAPEVILGYPWSTPIDIWTTGCLVTLLFP
jgi:serine/threonine-protein kinase SRPK3